MLYIPNSKGKYLNNFLEKIIFELGLRVNKKHQEKCLFSQMLPIFLLLYTYTYT